MKTKTAKDFKRNANFPNVIGCIDGSYIPIPTPAKRLRMTYVNRDYQTALTLQGICNAKGKFLDVITGFSSKLHDARVYTFGFVYPKIKEICAPDSPYHLLGDSAYPISSTLLTPFRHTGDMTDIQKKFNKALSGTRVKIENAFGLLKGRFRQRIRLDFHTVERSSYFIIASCVLHNMCIERDDLNFEEYIEESISTEDRLVPQTSAADKVAGEAKRNVIAATL